MQKLKQAMPILVRMVESLKDSDPPIKKYNIALLCRMALYLESAGRLLTFHFIDKKPDVYRGLQAKTLRHILEKTTGKSSSRKVGEVMSHSVVDPRLYAVKATKRLWKTLLDLSAEEKELFETVIAAVASSSLEKARKK